MANIRFIDFIELFASTLLNCARRDTAFREAYRGSTYSGAYLTTS